MKKILIVDDHPETIRLLEVILRGADRQFDRAENGERGLELARRANPDLILLDVMMPGGLDGYQVARHLKDDPETRGSRIIVMTAKRQPEDREMAFDSGADDYITKPFSSKELLARVQAVLKRSKAEKAHTLVPEIVCGDLLIDLARRVVFVSGREVYLTPTEYNLLYELATHPNQVLFHDYLLTKVWGAEYRDDVDYLRSYIHYLRKKLEADPSNPKLIVSSPGVGYMLEVPDEPNQV